jgi:hypothetical protein
MKRMEKKGEDLGREARSAQGCTSLLSTSKRTPFPQVPVDFD